MSDARGRTIVLATATATVAASACFLHWLRRRHRAPPFPTAKPAADVLKRGLRAQDLPEKADVIVIGAGPSGLALAVMLGRHGRRVLVLEQHDRAGGGLHTFSEQGFDFETGFHYAGELRPGKELRSIVDSLTGGEVDFAQLEDCPLEPGVYDKVAFPDGSSFVVPVSRAAWLEALEREFPEDRSAVEAYAEDLRANGGSSFPFMIWRSLSSTWLREFLRPYIAEPASRLSMRAAERLQKLTSNQRLMAVLGYLSLGCTGVALPDIDYRTVLGLHGHFGEGASFPVGGPSAIAAAMARQVERQGGRIFVRARVDGFTFGADGSVSGVRLQGEAGRAVRAPVVVSSVGVHGTAAWLRDQPCHAALSERLAPLQRTHGHIFLFVGLRGGAEELGLPRRNLWVLPGDDLKACMDRFQADPEAPFGYVGLAFPSAKDPSYEKRHPGYSTAALLAGDVPWEWFERWRDTRVHHHGKDYEEFKGKFADRLLEVLHTHYPKTRGRVEHVSAGTPLDTNFYLGKQRGESYGLQQTLAKSEADFSWMAARPQIPSWPKGLYLAGQDVTSDGFAPALVSAILATCAIEGLLPGWLGVVGMLGWRGTLKAILE